MQIKREPWAILSSGFAIIIGWSLYGFSPTDPSFNNAPAAVAEIANPIGIMGAYIADILLQLFGYAAWLLPLLMLVFTWRLLRGITQAHGGWNSIFWLFVGLCIAALAHAHLGSSSLPAGNGGALGSIIAGALSTLAGNAGRDVLLLVLLLSSLITAGQTSVINAIIYSLTAMSNVVEQLIDKSKNKGKHSDAAASDTNNYLNPDNDEPTVLANTIDDITIDNAIDGIDTTSIKANDKESKEDKSTATDDNTDTNADDENINFDDWDDLDVPPSVTKEKETTESESLDTLGFGDGAQGKDGGIRWVSEQKKQREQAEKLHNSESSNVRWRTMTGTDSSIANFVVADTGKFANADNATQQVETHTDFQTVPIPDMDDADDDIVNSDDGSISSLDAFDMDVDTSSIDKHEIEDKHTPTIPDTSTYDHSMTIPPVPLQQTAALDTPLLWDEHQDSDDSNNDENNENDNNNAKEDSHNEPHAHWDTITTEEDEHSAAMDLDADDLQSIPADMFERAITEDENSSDIKMATLEINGPSYEEEQAAMRADHFAIEDDDEENDDFDFSIDTADEAGFLLPHIGLFHCVTQENVKRSQQDLDEQAQLLEDKLQDYRISGQVIQAQQGPVVTQYEYEPSPGTKVSKIINLQEDLSRSMAAISVRVAGNIPSKNAISIEVANEHRETVYIYDVLASDAFQRGGHILPLCLGVDIAGDAVITDLATMPHLLVAGTTGSGKSVAVNTMICSMLMRHTPDRLRMIMVDPKMLELSTYADIPHLLTPVVTDPKQAAKALAWAAYEMDRRYLIMAEAKVRNIAGYNRIVASEGHHLPYIVVIIDELSDLMMTSGKEVEQHICRLAQKARAAGIHLILATQRPSVDVITGLIKANLPSRIAFQVSSRIDSRTILDQSGAEFLLGNGDMLFLNSGRNIMRVHGAFISEGEVQALAEHLKRQSEPQYDDALFANLEADDENTDDYVDEKYDDAIQLIINKGQASISMIQRNLHIGYNRAAKMIEQMEHDGLVTSPKAGGVREVLARKLDKDTF